MFYETDGGKLINLTLLQDVIVVKNEDDYSIGFVQINGEIIKDGNYTEQQANTKLAAIIAELTA